MDKMLLTKNDLRKMCQSHQWVITSVLEKYLLSIYGQEPDEYHEWSEQDIYEQVRKIILRQSNH